MNTAPITKSLRKKEFSFVNQLKKQHPQAEVFLVGGIIRDLMLKRSSKDYDFVIRNIPINKLQAFLRKHGHVDLVGKRFGVLKFIPEKTRLPEPIDIALPRTEHAFFTGRHQDFDVQFDPKLPIIDDLARRDFTINALAFNVGTKKIIDLFGGLEDMANKKITTVGQAEKRFQEDYSRMLRALRFACQLDFDIEKNTWAALKKLMPKINTTYKTEFVVPRETIAKELTKALVSKPAWAFQLLYKSGAIHELMPELLEMQGCPQPKNFHSEGDVWNHTLLCLKNLESNTFQKKFGKPSLSAELVYGLLFHDLGKPYTIQKMDRLRFNNHDSVGAEIASAIMKRIKLSNAGLNIDHVNWLIRKHLIATHSKKSPMKKTTLEKYFFNPEVPGDRLMQLTFVDIQATVPPSGKPDFTEYKRLEKQINDLQKTIKRKRDLPPEILNGREIMKVFKIKPGPEIGELKNRLREEQLKGRIKTKQQALTYLKKHA